MLIVSNYHYIRESFDAKYPSIFGLKPEAFEKQLVALSKCGTFIGQNDLLNYKERPFDKNYILITFDDGLSEQFELAKPILDKMGIPFVCFINTMNYTQQNVSLVHKIHMVRSELSSNDIVSHIKQQYQVELTPQEIQFGKENYSYDDEETAKLKYLLNFKLNIEQQEEVIQPLFNQLFNEKQIVSKLYFDDHQMKKLYDADALGSHSHSHVPLGYLTEEEIHKEFEQTQRFFKNKFNQHSYSISYPYGSFEACDKVTEIAQKYHFELGFSMERAANVNLHENPLMISRYDCNDLPAGKSNRFENAEIFSSSLKSAWYR